MSHSIIEPAILYWGTPVVLVTSRGDDNIDNISAISSAFWLGDRCILGFGANSKTPQNIQKARECVVNLPDDSMAYYVNKLALTTGTAELPDFKSNAGYQYVKDKWMHTGLIADKSDIVSPARIRQCPVQMECALVETHSLMEDVPSRAGAVVVLELRVLRTHVVPQIRLTGYANRIDPDKWRPLFMSFQQLYGLAGQKATESRLANVDEEQYRPLISK